MWTERARNAVPTLKPDPDHAGVGSDIIEEKASTHPYTACGGFCSLDQAGCLRRCYLKE